MPVLPHATAFFDAVALHLRCDDGPQTPSFRGWEIEVDAACRYLDQLGAFIESENGKRLRCWPSPTELRVIGGEPFSRLDALDRIVSCAKDNRFIAHVWTTANWVQSKANVGETLSRLAGKIHAISLYTNKELLRLIGLERIALLLSEARESRVGLVIQCAVGPDHPFPRELLSLEAINSDSSLLQVVAAPGLNDATRHGDRWDGFLLPEPPRYRRCAEKFVFAILPGGDVYPCSHGIGMETLRIGSLATESVQDIVKRACGDNRLRRLRDCGPHYLYQAAKQCDARSELLPGYVDACHFHRHVLANPALRNTVAVVENRLSGLDGGDQFG